MQHFLLVYDRRAGKILREDVFDDGKVALTERFRVERLHRGDPNIEVVVLGAASRQALYRTHARYFLTLRELLSDAYYEAL
ncbi:MAG TPA: hypothetical protein VNQ77_04570 [Frankiaceae bacterium]|nr:hypothetical protein [Frankiaceae bacterium]